MAAQAEDLHMMLSDIKKLASFLKEHHPLDMLMPVHGPNSMNKSTKQPVCKHVGGQWSWDQYDHYRRLHPTHSEYAILCQTICVVDNDTQIDDLEARFPELHRAPMETTTKGGHRFFLRSPLSDSGEFWDAIAPVLKKVDFKTRTSKGTGGVIVVAPSTGKVWVRSLFDHPMETISDGLLIAVAKSQLRQDVTRETRVKRAREQDGSVRVDHERSEVASGSPVERSTKYEVSILKLRTVVMSLAPSRADARATWINVIFAIGNVSRDNRYSELGRALAHDFSKQVMVKYDRGKVDETLDSVNDRRVGSGFLFGSLRRWLQEDVGKVRERAIMAEIKSNEARYAFVEDAEQPYTNQLTSIASTSAREQPVNTSCDSTGTSLNVALLKFIEARLPSHYASLCSSTFSATLMDSRRLHLQDSTSGFDEHMLYPTCCFNGKSDLLEITIRGVDRYVPMLAKNTTLVLSREIINKQDISQLRGQDPNGEVIFSIYDMYGNRKATNASMKVGARTIDIKRHQLNSLLDMVESQTADQVAAGLGEDVGALFQQINIGTLHVYVGERESENHQTEDILINALLASSSNFRDRVGFSPDALASCSGLCWCSEQTNIWSSMNNYIFNQQVLVPKLGLLPGLNTNDTRFIQSSRGKESLRSTLAGAIGDPSFAARIDGNLNIFACMNGVFDLSGVPFFRDTRVDDMVKTHTGWAYNADDASLHRPALELFLQQVLPVSEERRVVLTYIAHLLSGKRDAKKFLILTDKRGGNNGKSSLAKLFLRFFGKLAMRNTSFVCKGSFDKDKNSHDASLGPTHGKRLLVADELKNNMTLDVVMFKEMTGGGDTSVSGRAFGSADVYDYVWQAGFLLIFNENDCPKFDVADDSFVSRMIVAPMRSKFVDLGSNVGEEPHTFQLQPSMIENFTLWLPALADLLMEKMHQDHSLLRNIPAAMSEWRHSIADQGNPVADWLEKRITFTKNAKDVLSMAQINGMRSLFFVPGNPHSVGIGPKRFSHLAKAHLMGMGCGFVKQTTIDREHINNLFTGVMFARMTFVDQLE